MTYKKNLSQTEDVYFRIREEVLSGILLPGMKIKINDLCRKNDASLGAVREALSRLTAEGLVQSQAQKGFKVSPVSIKDLEDLTLARIEIESLCLEHSIKDGDVDWESSILAASHKLKSTYNKLFDEQNDQIKQEWELVHSHFHYLLVSACTNQWLLTLRDYLYAQSERYRRIAKDYDIKKRNANLEHEKLMNAVIDKNIELAKQLIYDHIQMTKRIVLEAIETKE